MEGKVVATQGSGTFLIDVGKGKARVFDIERKVIYTPFNLDSIIARGYWDEYDAEEEGPIDVPSLVKGAKELDLEGNETGEVM